MTKLLNIDLKIQLHDDCADDAGHYEVQAAFVDKEGYYADLKELNAFIPGQHNNAFVNPSTDEGRATLHAMLDRYLDACVAQIMS